MKPVFCGRFHDSGFWFRIFGVGLEVKLRGHYVPLFSERNGHRTPLRVGPLNVFPLGPL